MRYLRGNAGSYTPSNLMFVDTETKPKERGKDGKPGRSALYLGVVLSARWGSDFLCRKRFHRFRTVPEFWEIARRAVRPKSPLWIFSHNSGFDATVCGLWEAVDKGTINLGFAITDSPPSIFGFSLLACRCYWVDSLNWFTQSVAKLGEALNIPKLQMPSEDASMEDWFVYCQRDVEVLAYAMEALFRFHRKHDLGVFKLTVSGQALQTYRHRFMEKQPCIFQWEDKHGTKRQRTEMVGIIEPHDKDIVKRLERQSYCTGYAWVYRVCAVRPFFGYFIGNDRRDSRTDKALALGPVYVLDVNSMYPSVMKDCIFPHRLRGYCLHNDRTGLYRKMDEYHCIANVLIDTHTRPYPVKRSDGTNYHIGKFWTTLPHPELAKAREECCIRAVAMFAWYDAKDLFSSYVDYFYPLKVEYRKLGNKVFEGLCKQMLNSLPGKFGQYGGKWMAVKNGVPKVRWQQYSQHCKETNKVESYRGLGDLLQMRSPEVDAEHTLTAIPATVNSYARLRLHDYIQTAGVRNVFYVNVDSIHCSEEGYERLVKAGLVSEFELGKLRLEGVYSSAEYRDVRNYTLGGVHTIAGVSSKAVEKGNLCFEQPEFERLDSILDRPQDSTVNIQTVEKEVTGEFRMGAIDDEGYTHHRRLSGLETRQLDGIVDNEEQLEE